jgi:DeoR/GlpR family transcriptional regulator of sugar metabolism
MQAAMFDGRRRQRILERLASAGEVEVSVLAAEFGCSAKTIRRDLAALARGGHLMRQHGGAIVAAAPDLPPVLRRADRDRQAKERAAALVPGLVPAGGLVFLGGGSTMLAVAARLRDLPASVGFVTIMPDIAQLLAHDGQHEVHLAGGRLNPANRTVEGAEALRFLEPRRFDLALIGASAIDAEDGVMGPSAGHRDLAEVIRRCARRLTAVADASKFGRADRYALYGFERIEAVVTDRPPSDAIIARMRAAGTALLMPEPA